MSDTGIAVRQGDVLSLFSWSNTAVTLRGIVGFRPSKGKPATLQLDQVALTTRAQALTQATIDSDGVIDSAAIVALTTAPAQRGQCYAWLLVGRGASPGLVVQTLCADYIFVGNIPTLGHVVSPGPAGGHGQIVALSGTNQAAGTLPTDQLNAPGAYRRLISYEVALLTDANAGNRQFALVVDDSVASQRTFVAQNSNNQAATLTRTWAWYIGTDLSTSVGATFTDTAVVLPAYNLKRDLAFGVTSNIRLVSTGALAFTATDDFAAPILQVEEWVMPN